MTLTCLLSSIRVRTKFAVVDMTTEGSQTHSKARQRRLASLAHKKENKKDRTLSKNDGGKNSLDMTTSYNQLQEHTGEITSLPPPLVRRNLKWLVMGEGEVGGRRWRLVRDNGCATRSRTPRYSRWLEDSVRMRARVRRDRSECGVLKKRQMLIFS